MYSTDTGKDMIMYNINTFYYQYVRITLQLHNLVSVWSKTIEKKGSIEREFKFLYEVSKMQV